MSSQPLADISPEEILDTALQKMQSEGIEPVEWHALLFRRMNVPRIVSVSRPGLLHFPSNMSGALLQYYSFLVPDEDFQRASDLLEQMGLPLRTPFLLMEADIQANGRSHFIRQSVITPLEHRLVVYPLSFAGVRSCEISEQPAQYSKLHRCSHILVPRPSAVYASLLRIMLRYPPDSMTWSVLLADISLLMLYHLMGYTLETVSDDDEEDEDRRTEAALETVREWGVRKEWADGEVWMESALCGLVRGDCLYPQPP
jgi:hypothetical protein